MGSTHSVDRIRAAIDEILATVGADGLTFRSVASQSGLSVGSVAYYFESRNALLQFALEPHHRQVASSMGPTGNIEQPMAIQLGRALTEFAFVNRDEVRTQLLCFVEAWDITTLPHLRAGLDAAARIEGGSEHDASDRKCEALLLALGLQHIAAMQPDQLADVLGLEDDRAAAARVVAAVVRIARQLLADTPLAAA